MTPAASWSPDDYYRASRAARRAAERTYPQQQIQGVLEEVQATRADGDGCGLPLLEPAAPSYASPREAGSTTQTTAPAACPPQTGAAGATGGKW